MLEEAISDNAVECDEFYYYYYYYHMYFYCSSTTYLGMYVPELRTYCATGFARQNLTIEC